MGRPRGAGREDHAAATSRWSATGRLILGGAIVVAIAVIALTSIAVRRPTQATPAAAPGQDTDTVVVDQPAIDLGRVRLNVAVPVTVRLANHSGETVTLGRPTVETLEGC